MTNFFQIEKKMCMTILSLMNLNESSTKGQKTLWEKEIACFEQILLFPQCFPKTCSADK